MTIRPYQSPDLPALRALLDEVLRDGTTFAYTDLEELVSSWLGPGCHLFVCEEDGSVMGGYVIKPNFPGRGAHVANGSYAVATAARGRMLGYRLGEHSLEQARSLGFRAMQFNLVVSTNQPAIRLWEKLGFVVVGRLPQVFQHPVQGEVDAFVMWRAL